VGALPQLSRFYSLPRLPGAEARFSLRRSRAAGRCSPSADCDFWLSGSRSRLASADLLPRSGTSAALGSSENTLLLRYVARLVSS